VLNDMSRGERQGAIASGWPGLAIAAAAMLVVGLHLGGGHSHV